MTPDAPRRTAESAERSVTIARARPEQREELMALIDGAFRKPVAGELPHLFEPARIGNHHVAAVDGRLAAVVGVYPHGFRCRDVVFDTAGIGQVATSEDCRGLGLMSRLLAPACEEADRYDFTWLHGDQLRYGRYGWSRGGLAYAVETFDKYLPEPRRSAEIRPLDLVRDRALIDRAVARAPQACLLPADEFSLLLKGARGRMLSGWVLGEAFLLADRDGARIIDAEGDEAALTELLAHAARALRRHPGDRWKLEILCPPEPTPLLAVGRRHAWTLTVRASANFRIGRLAPFLRKACRLAPPPARPASGRLGLANADTGDAATVRWDGGRFDVEEGAGADAIRLSTFDLSDLCFGLWPPDLLLPLLPPDSPVRQVLPLRLFIPHLFDK
jgi:GNAT superfamily N-acetyltransferase